MKSEENILIIADTHEPFSHKHYLDFCLETKKKFKCTKVFHSGDLVDNHAISYHEKNPDGFSSKTEADKAQEKLFLWYKAFPKVNLCIGNHDELPQRKGKTHGIGSRFIRSFREAWNLPKGWDYKYSYQYKGVKYFHGTGYSGLYPHINAANSNRQKVVIGHLHSVAGVGWTASDHDLIFGLVVGCGIDRKSYAFQYGKYLKRKPILGCGVVLDRNSDALFVPMNI